jgi:hypothetical protein
VSEFHHFAIVFDDCAQGNDIRPQHLPNQGSFTIRKMEDFDDDFVLLASRRCGQRKFSFTTEYLSSGFIEAISTHFHGHRARNLRDIHDQPQWRSFWKNRSTTRPALFNHCYVDWFVRGAARLWRKLVERSTSRLNMGGRVLGVRRRSLDAARGCRLHADIDFLIERTG